MRQGLAALVALSLAQAGAAAASEKPISFLIGGGASFPLSDAADRFDAGWSFTAGVDWNIGDHLGLRLDYLYAGHDVKARLDDLTLDASHSLQYGAASLVLGTPRGDGPRVYVLGGPGLYFRAVEITRLDSFVGSFCDPWLFLCFTGPVQVEQVIGSRDATDWGLQGGLGLSFRVGSSARLFLEARYHHVFGDEFDGQPADAQYVPITLGVEF
ncbi:MAG TPA: outer membrane beta-barrel protein [Vicinamibacteria bacterium]|nr:outer membrane beta-barrel protein [Vicinamibacteria bacterium]